MNRPEFDYALVAAGMDYRGAADYLGITEQELEEKLSELSEFTPEQIDKLASRFGLTPEGIDIIFFGGDPDMEI